MSTESIVKEFYFEEIRKFLKGMADRDQLKRLPPKELVKIMQVVGWSELAYPEKQFVGMTFEEVLCELPYDERIKRPPYDELIKEIKEKACDRCCQVGEYSEELHLEMVKKLFIL